MVQKHPEVGLCGPPEANSKVMLANSASDMATGMGRLPNSGSDMVMGRMSNITLDMAMAQHRPGHGHGT